MASVFEKLAILLVSLHLALGCGLHHGEGNHAACEAAAKGSGVAACGGHRHHSDSTLTPLAEDASAEMHGESASEELPPVLPAHSGCQDDRCVLAAVNLAKPSSSRSCGFPTGLPPTAGTPSGISCGARGIGFAATGFPGSLPSGGAQILYGNWRL